MARTTTREVVSVLFLICAVCATILAGEIIRPNNPLAADVFPPNSDASNASYVIFSNLSPPGGDRYNTSEFAAVPVNGKDVFGKTEQWQAVRFTPKVDVQAKVLAAAIAYISGAKLIKLGLYDNDEIFNTVGNLLPGGEGSTTDIPALGDCCKLARVTLPGAGIKLLAGVQYWLVASSDDVGAPTFEGQWQLSNLAISAGMAPPLPWGNFPGQWPAALIRGTQLQPTDGGKALATELPSAKYDAPAANVTIFTNLDRTGSLLYLYGIGSTIAGEDALSGELWQALPFTPRSDMHARTLAAAIGYTSGTKLVNLGIYSDNAGTVGDPLPGGEGSTTDIPDSGVCCGLTRVRLPQPVALSANVQYWLVASPDNRNAPDFKGLWQHSDLALRAYNEPELFSGWTSLTGWWLAAEIRGTNP